MKLLANLFASGSMGGSVQFVRDACKPEVFLEFMMSVSIERGPVIREQNRWETMSGEHLVEGVVLSLTPVPLTTSTSGYLVSRSTSTSRYSSSGVGPPVTWEILPLWQI